MHKSYLLLGKYQIIVISYLRNETAQMSIVGEIWKRSFQAADHVAGDRSACLQGVARAWAPPAQVPSRSPASAGGTAILRAGASILSLTAASFSPGCLFHRRQHVRRAGVTLLCTGFSSASQGRQHQSCHPTCHSRACLNPCHNCETTTIRAELREICQQSICVAWKCRFKLDTTIHELVWFNKILKFWKIKIILLL